ncbi:hypothetical protein AWJ14_09095 [Hoeflea olei]|uniref:Uncharacterized protein n=2 Tax=Hoeflea olei TaxID=1480615 RepID=A0A1C1Z0E6_9HYPH|nr:hypothetical protein AWJ14_09095 [Hoeflea olei]
MLILAGWKDMVKPDRRVKTQMEKILNRTLQPHYAAEVLREAAFVMKVNPSDLDLTLWQMADAA